MVAFKNDHANIVRDLTVMDLCLFVFVEHVGTDGQIRPSLRARENGPAFFSAEFAYTAGPFAFVTCQVAKLLQCHRLPDVDPQVGEDLCLHTGPLFADAVQDIPAVRSIAILIRAHQYVLIRANGFQFDTELCRQILRRLRIRFGHLAKRHPRINPPTEFNAEFSHASCPLADARDDQQFIAFDQGHRVATKVRNDAFARGRSFVLKKPAAQPAQRVKGRYQAPYLLSEISIAQPLGKSIQEGFKANDLRVRV